MRGSLADAVLFTNCLMSMRFYDFNDASRSSSCVHIFQYQKFNTYKMPRTRKKQRKSSGKDALKEEIKKTQDDLQLQFETEKINLLVTVDTLLKQNFLNFTTEELQKTPHELQTEISKDSSQFTDLSSLRSVNISNKKRQRSLSCGDDEGYLTSGSVNNGNKNRSRLLTKLKQTNKKKNIRSSRSLSRSKFRDPIKHCFITPLNKVQPNKGICTITPKVNPNTPQVILRRPKQGEVAVSMQGSPLMVSNVVSDEVANVNIPLADGKILTMQPFRGEMRYSQIPDLSPGTTKQIQTLRDNLNQLCKLGKK